MKMTYGGTPATGTYRPNNQYGNLWVSYTQDPGIGPMNFASNLGHADVISFDTEAEREQVVAATRRSAQYLTAEGQAQVNARADRLATLPIENGDNR